MRSIWADYQLQGFGLTLRQLYYQFVARVYLANKDTEYKQLGDIINDARLAANPAPVGVRVPAPANRISDAGY